MLSIMMHIPLLKKTGRRNKQTKSCDLEENFDPIKKSFKLNVSGMQTKFIS